MTDRQARDLPLDAHMHTDLSPDSNVPIDIYAAAALERGIAEIAITDHVDFEPGAPAFALLDLRGSRTDRPRRRRALGATGRRHPVRRRADLRPSLGGRTSATTWPATPTTSRSARSTTGWTRHTSRDAWRPGSTAARWRRSSRRRSTRSRRRPGPGCSTPSATSTSSSATSTRTSPPAALAGGARAVRADPAGARRERHGPRGQHERPALRRSANRSRTPAIVARFRELGGRAVTVGSDAHRAEHVRLGPGGRLRHRGRRPGSTELTFRRGSGDGPDHGPDAARGATERR